MHPYEKTFPEMIATFDRASEVHRANTFYARTSAVLLGLGLAAGVHAIAQEAAPPAQMATVNTRLEHVGLPERVLDESYMPAVFLTFLGGVSTFRTWRRIQATRAVVVPHEAQFEPPLRVEEVIPAAPADPLEGRIIINVPSPDEPPVVPPQSWQIGA